MSAEKPATLAMLPWFPRDYLAATRGMTLAERGAYTDMLFYAWDSGRPLPVDTSRIARMLGVSPEEFMKIWPSIKSKFVFTADGNGMVNERLERERAKSIEMKAKALERAKMGGEATRRKHEQAYSQATSTATSQASSLAGSTAQATQQASSPSPSPSPSPSTSSTSSPSHIHMEGERGNHEAEPAKAKRQKPVSGETEGVERARKLIKARPEDTDSQIARVAATTTKSVKAARALIRNHH